MLLKKSCWNVIFLQSEIVLYRELKKTIFSQCDTLSNRNPFLKESLTEGNLILGIRPELLFMILIRN